MRALVLIATLASLTAQAQPCVSLTRDTAHILIPRSPASGRLSAHSRGRCVGETVLTKGRAGMLTVWFSDQFRDAYNEGDPLILRFRGRRVAYALTNILTPGGSASVSRDSFHKARRK